MLKKWLGGLTIVELAKRTWRETNDDYIWGRAAELAYYFLLALFPMLIFLTSLIGFLPDAQTAIFHALARVMPSEAMKLVSDTIQDVTSNRHGGLLSFGVLGTIWAASGGLWAVMGTLNEAYDAKEERSLWKMQLIAIALTIALSFLIVGGVVLIMLSDKFSVWLAAQLGLGHIFAIIWRAVHFVLGFALVFLGLQVIYYFGPNVKQAWRWVTPGAAFAVLSLLLASLLLTLYLRFAPSYSATYGSLGAVIVLMLWLYLMGLAVLIGGEINSEIAHASDAPLVTGETKSAIVEGTVGGAK